MQNEFEREDAIQAIRMCELNGLTGTAEAIKKIMAGLSRVENVSQTPRFSNATESHRSD